MSRLTTSMRDFYVPKPFFESCVGSAHGTQGYNRLQTNANAKTLYLSTAPVSTP